MGLVFCFGILHLCGQNISKILSKFKSKRHSEIEKNENWSIKQLFGSKTLIA